MMRRVVMRFIVGIIKVRRFMMQRLKMTNLMNRVMLNIMMWQIMK